MFSAAKLAQNLNPLLDTSNMGHPLKSENMLPPSLTSNKAVVFYSSFLSHTGIVSHFLMQKMTTAPLIIVSSTLNSQTAKA